ncbi:MAG: folKP [Rickettsiaceae bacterium]|jgi:dihydropteroate synthase|nr:folKP [Rickettsiaceae bacterium]
MMTKLVGILNITPDSFSDGGKFTQVSSALLQAEKLITDGAAVIDIGAESTRPNAIPINADEEWQRLEQILPAIIKLCHQRQVLASLDTRHAFTAEKAIDLGIDWINDVDGFNQSGMIDTVKNSHAHLVFMHSLGVPADKNKTLPSNIDVIQLVYQWAENKILQLQQAGIAKEHLIFDPGIGFGKTPLQSWQLINNIEAFQSLGVKILVGHSRKSFLGDGDRDVATLAVSKELIVKKVDYLRVHEIIQHSLL